MGINVLCFADMPSGLEPSDVGLHLSKSARRWAAHHGLDDLFYSAEQGEEGAWLSFYPLGGEIRFAVSDRRIEFDAKTSIAGPGFHAALIDLCDQFEKDIGMKWRWDAGGDDSGYAIDRDFARLQRAFAGQFLGYCEACKDLLADDWHLGINLPEGLAVDVHDSVATPMGPLPVNFVVEASDEPHAAEDNARRVFPWWSKAADNQFRLNTLRALLWTVVDWRAPRSPWEEHVHKAVFRLAARCNLANEPDIETAIAELTVLSARADQFIPPSARGIGYGRHTRRFSLPGNWRIKLPGYYIEAEENDGDTVCLWFGSEEIRGSSLKFTFKDASSLQWPEPFQDSPEHVLDRCSYRLAPIVEASEHHDGCFTAMALLRSIDSDGTGHVLVLTLFDMKPDLMPRLEFIASRVSFEPPTELPGSSRGT